MNYYSDINFKGYINSCGEPVISGGRYNHLSEKFGIPRPACGFAIDILKVIDYMEQHQLRPCDNATIHVIFYESDDVLTAYQLADELRQAGKIADIFMIKSSLADHVQKLHQNPLYKNANIYYLSQKKLFLEQNDEFFAIDTIFSKSEVK